CRGRGPGYGARSRSAPHSCATIGKTSLIRAALFDPPSERDETSGAGCRRFGLRIGTNGDTMFDYDRLHTAVSTLRQKKIFFIGGTPKSGSTWLQLLLNAHPAVSCSGEGHFPDRLWEPLRQAVGQHCQSIQEHNKKLFNGLSGYPRLTDEDFLYIFRSCIAVFLVEQSKHKIAYAIGD